MTDTSELSAFLQNMISKKENVELEFKHAHGGFPRNFWETYSAFANTEGGVIVFGVKEKNGQFILDPIDETLSDSLVKTFWKQVRSRDCISACLLVDSDVRVCDFKGKKILLFFVPKVEVALRPVYVGRDPMEGTFRRGYEGDYKCRPDEVRLMFADADSRHPADGRLLDGFSLDDLDTETIEQYRQRMAVANPDHVWLNLDTKQLLQKLGGYRIDRKTQKEGLTLAGILMFGRWSSIRDVDALPKYGVDYREYSEGSERWSHRIFSDGSWEANLFQFFFRVLPRLQNVIELPFHLEGVTRIDHKSAHKSIREALVNTIIHADYGADSRIVINKFPNEIVFGNPGTMLVSVTQFFTGGVSICRNPALQTMFSLIGVGDQAGSGGDVILNGWRNENFRTPSISCKYNPDRVELTLPLEHLLSPKVKDSLRRRFGKDILELDHDSLMVLAMALDEKVSNRSLQYLLDLHPSDITRLLRKLCRQGYLVQSGIGRGTEYTTAPIGTNSEAGDVSSDVNEAIDNSERKASIPVDNCSDNSESFGNDGVSKGKDLIIEQVRVYCSVWRKSSDIAKHVAKSVSYITRTIIPFMIEEGLLIREYVDSPTHPAQRYRAKPK